MAFNTDSFLEGLGNKIKDVGRNIPVVADIFGLTTPEEMAANRLRGGLEQSRQQMIPAYQQASQRYSGLTGLLGGLPGLQQQIQSRQFTPDMPQMRQQAQFGQQPQLPQFQDFQFNLEEDPGFQFAKQQGTDAVRDYLASKGLSDSGAEMQEIAKYTTGLASQYAPQMRQQAFNEYQQNIQNQANQFGLGQRQYEYGTGLGQRQHEFGVQSDLDRYRTGLAGGAQQYGQQMGLVGLGMQGLGAQTGLETGLADILSGYSQQAGQIGANEKMARAQQIRGMLDQGAQLAGSLYGSPGGS